MMTQEEAIQYLIDADVDALLMEPQIRYNGCIIGIGFRFTDEPVAVYSIDRVLTVLQEDGPMTAEEAQEYYERRIIGGWSGDGMPIYMYEVSQDNED